MVKGSAVKWLMSHTVFKCYRISRQHNIEMNVGKYAQISPNTGGPSMDIGHFGME